MYFIPLRAHCFHFEGQKSHKCSELSSTSTFHSLRTRTHIPTQWKCAWAHNRSDLAFRTTLRMLSRLSSYLKQQLKAATALHIWVRGPSCIQCPGEQGNHCTFPGFAQMTVQLCYQPADPRERRTEAPEWPAVKHCEHWPSSLLLN